MSIVQRVKLLHLPLDQLVVIGSGVVDALGLRRSSDIDLVVSDELFVRLQNGGAYQVNQRHGDTVLESDGVEIWRDWGNELPFDILYRDGVTIDGITFCHPATVLQWKQRHDRPKDQVDIRLLQQYLDKTA